MLKTDQAKDNTSILVKLKQCTKTAQVSVHAIKYNHQFRNSFLNEIISTVDTIMKGEESQKITRKDGSEVSDITTATNGRQSKNYDDHT